MRLVGLVPPGRNCVDFQYSYLSVTTLQHALSRHAGYVAGTSVGLRRLDAQRVIRNVVIGMCEVTLISSTVAPVQCPSSKNGVLPVQASTGTVEAVDVATCQRCR